MTDRPIIFSAPMIIALLAGTKTQTRRLLRTQPFSAGYHNGGLSLDNVTDDYARFSAMAVGASAIIEHIIPLSYATSDRLWVKEAFCFDAQMDAIVPAKMSRYEPRGYPANDWVIEPAAIMVTPGRIRSARFMPRWASRLTLTVTDVRVQRLQDISEDDAVAEGVHILAERAICHGPECANDISRICSKGGCDAPVRTYAHLWDTLHSPGAWDANPWVCALTFTVQRGNIDTV